MLDLALLDQISNGAGDLLDRNGWIDAVLIEKIDRVDLKALERSLYGLLDTLGAAVAATYGITGFDIKTKFCRDQNFVTLFGESFPNELFICVGSVDLGCIK